MNQDRNNCSMSYFTRNENYSDTVSVSKVTSTNVSISLGND